MAKLILAVFLLFVTYAVCDLYMHNPRGSNDRLNEANTNRNNGNRLFDSQNNAKGGYCVGPAMTYYEGSMLSVEWTNQHGCGNNPKVVCNIVLQYMCGSTNDDPLVRVRDGTTTNTPNTNNADATSVTNGQLTFGMHESLRSYLNCNTRARNTGLYIADRATEGGLTPARATAIYTRQNNNGNRNGYECAEERDYYPYWHPSQWRDVAIMTSDKKFCDFYQAESQNVKAKGYCISPNGNDNDVQTAQNTPASCTGAGNTWTEAPAFGIKAPECVPVPWSRENQLGNGASGFANTYNMTIPHTEDLQNCINDDTCVCALRLRYNISTIEDGFPDMSRPDAGFIDSNNNGNNAVNTQDPTLNVTDADGNQVAQVELALDTSQFGRTFQDRSHTFKITKRPDGVPRSARLYNLNVRGKRGNIVQTYPAVEYDFVPQFLYTRVGDYVHFQWTGCDTNPAGNAGEGTDQTDRSNYVQIISLDNAYPVTDDWVKKNPKKVFISDQNTRTNYATLGQEALGTCLTREQILKVNGNNEGNAEQDVRNCGKLNAATNYFDGGVLRMNVSGSYYYMSTRNHNFSNRDQKGVVYVQNLLPTWAIAVVIVGGVIFLGSGAVAGAMFYAKSHPHSGIANMFSKL